ncbi:hydroxymethylglutaryl-CoA reductase, degradative [Streptococcus iniae]|nr:hydroxymethylglutaryl-CoA reductase, degradative [Streptococcus iniae]
MKKMTSKINWSGFHKKTPHDRLVFLQDNHLLSEQLQEKLKLDELLALDTANQMAENVIGRLALPFSIAPDFLINGKTYHVPFVTEEPSVVAAAAFAAKIMKRTGGFKTKVHDRQMIGQVALYDIKEMALAQRAIIEASEQLITLANQAYPSIVKRGGGARRIKVDIKEDFLLVYMTVDTQEAMGANMVNTMMEALSPELERLTQGKTLMAILSNYATESLVSAECCLPLRFLSRDPKEAYQLAHKMALASQLAQIDPYRAATHNKGILNGIDAVVMATGNDWRAIEAGSHAYAAKDHAYKGLTQWYFNADKGVIEGNITLPMPIATKGGSIGLNPSVMIAHDLLGHPTAKELAQIIAAVGLAQNFAALKALTNSGIQAGHMKLQAKSLALLAGANESELPQLLTRLLNEKHMNQETAQLLLKNLRQEK